MQNREEKGRIVSRYFQICDIVNRFQLQDSTSIDIATSIVLVRTSGKSLINKIHRHADDSKRLGTYGVGDFLSTSSFGENEW